MVYKESANLETTIIESVLDYCKNFLIRYAFNLIKQYSKSKMFPKINNLTIYLPVML
jgi:hypothetical protein